LRVVVKSQLLFTALKTKRMINALPIGKAFSDGLAG